METTAKRDEFGWPCCPWCGQPYLDCQCPTPEPVGRNVEPLSVPVAAMTPAEEREMETESRTTSPYYSIADSRLEEIVSRAQAREPERTADEIEGTLLADWPEGQEHQDWLDTADVEEIVGWVLVAQG